MDHKADDHEAVDNQVEQIVPGDGSAKLYSAPASVSTHARHQCLSSGPANSTGDTHAEYYNQTFNKTKTS